MLKRSLFMCALMLSAAVTPVRADDLSNRMDQMEEQIRQLTGQVEQLTYQLKQMQAQKKLGAADQTQMTPPALAAPQASDQADASVAPAPAAAPPPALPFKKKSAAPTIAAASNSDGVEQIGETPIDPQTGQPMVQGGDQQAQTQQVQQPKPVQQSMALAPKPQGMNAVKSAQAGDGGFQGQVLVPAGGEDQQQQQQQASIDPNAANGAQNASLDTPQADTPDDLYMRANQALLQRRFDDASAGFKDFIAKYPDHTLAGNAEFWLGETYWLQQDYQSAAQAYLNSYKQYPKSSRAAESLLKLGQSFSRLGQKDQACAMLGSVDTDFPKAVDVRKRAQAELKREGCAS